MPAREPPLNLYLQVRGGFPSVELRGFEPLTFSLRTRRATNCATAPLRLRNRREQKRYHLIRTGLNQDPTARCCSTSTSGTVSSAASAAAVSATRAASSAVRPDVQVPGSSRSIVRTVRRAFGLVT
jgi:hypothetical protein